MIRKNRFGLYQDVRICGTVQRFRWIPPGKFLMGSSVLEKDRQDDEIQHETLLTRGFWLADTTVTQELWEAVMEYNPSTFKGFQNPVEMVSWHDCQVFIDEVNRLVPGPNFRFPTEAEWEYACRAGK
jgi:formylglycine-generating enzyme required for sulfatase activity